MPGSATNQHLGRRQRRSKKRVVVGFLLAPLTPDLLCAPVWLLVPEFRNLLGGSLCFVSYVLAWVFGVPGYLCFESRSWRRLWHYALGGFFFIQALCWVVLSQVIINFSFVPFAESSAVMGLLGAATAVVFWTIAVRVPAGLPASREGVLLWETVQREFVWEGSWRDICITDVGLDGWKAAVKAIRAAPFRTQFTLDGRAADLPEDVGDVFTRRDETALWKVFVQGLQLNCHFFGEAEIEFDLDPREVTGQEEFDSLIAFMRTLAVAVDQVVLMTPENMHDVPFLRVPPAGAVEYISSKGFFEELALGRTDRITK